MKIKNLLISLGLVLSVGAGIGTALAVKDNVKEAKAAETLNYTNYDIEIRCTRPKWWANNTVYIHTWHNGEDNVYYEMKWIWDNENSEAVFAWNPSETEPLYENMVFEVASWANQSSDLISPRSSGIYNFYDDSGWKNNTVEKMKLYLYDYDKAFNGVDLYAHSERIGADSLVYDSGDGVAMTKENSLTGNGLVYSVSVSNAINQITFQTAGGTLSLDELTGMSANYCYVHAPVSEIADHSTWWSNIEYVYAHNWAMNLLNFRNYSAVAGAGLDTGTCETNYSIAKTVYNYCKTNDPYVLNEISGSFHDSLDRMAKWAIHNGESFSYESDGEGHDIGTFSSKVVSALEIAENNSSKIAMIIVISASIISMLAVGGYFFLRKRKEDR